MVSTGDHSAVDSTTDSWQIVGTATRERRWTGAEWPAPFLQASNSRITRAGSTPVSF
jgi:hypothetical protein